MNLRTIPPGTPFLRTLAAWWLGRSTDPLRRAEGLILLPTRRAARALAEAFIAEAAGEPILLPRIAAVGALDEPPLTLGGALELPPAIGQAERLATLATQILALRGAFGAPRTADRAWPLAAELARLLDEAHRGGVDLSRALPGLAGENYAEHWTHTLDFLRIVTAHWPEWLADRGALDGAERGVKLLEEQARHWAENPPGHPVVVAGTPGGIRALGALMRVVARLPKGLVVLPGLDLDMDAESWDALDPGHPQAGMRALLADMGATRGDVRPWPGTAADDRGRALSRAMLPAVSLGQWREGGSVSLGGLHRLAPADEQEEAVAIALALRDALERPGVQAALVTPDRALAVRVAAELGRFGVLVDDSAGEPLAETPPGAFLRLLAEAVAAGLSPVALLSVLKHPFAALGYRPAECRALSRRLEVRILRGPAPAAGVAGLRRSLEAALAPDDLHGLLDRLEAALVPLARLPDPAAPDAALRALIEAGEALAATPEEGSGAERLWALEEGEALAAHLASLLDALPVLPPQPAGTLPGLLAASLEGAVVRSRRVLRGRKAAEHPRVAILGLLEARLQSFDVLVLGGLAEGVWPPVSDPGPWMSRPMRAAAGLPSPEEAVGGMAHDFALLCSAAPEVILSCPRRREGAPAVPARWLVRLEAFLRGKGTALPQCPAAAWARLLDAPDGEPRPVAPPRPCPPPAFRPRRLGVTKVETWLRDPYGIYASEILRLRALAPLEQPVETADFGSLVHRALAEWVSGAAATDAAAGRAAFDRALDAGAFRPALVAWWRPRLHRIADWAAGAETARRTRRPHELLRAEVSGEWDVPVRGEPFTLVARADRIERLPGGGLAILDYKTGAPPGKGEVLGGYASQLPLEAAMVAGGGFGPDLVGTVEELTYWHLGGGFVPGEETNPLRTPALVAEATDKARDRLAALIERYDNPAQPYLSQPRPDAAPRFTDYAQLARVGEWAAAGEGGAGEGGE